MDVDAATRASLHGIAEGILAGPQHERSGTIRLRVLQGGFGTVSEPALRVAGAALVVDGRHVPLAGTFADLAAAAGVRWTVPSLYSDHAPVAEDDEVVVDPAAAARIAGWFERGRQALVAFAPGQTPVLWPEHFDLAVDVREVTYGVSPGDAHSAAPYAYVGPWSSQPGPFWNAPFGALRPADEIPTVEALVHFFRAGQEQAARPAGGTG